MTNQINCRGYGARRVDGIKKLQTAQTECRMRLRLCDSSVFTLNVLINSTAGPQKKSPLQDSKIKANSIDVISS